MQAFRDKVVIVTGGASGIGRAMCREMGSAGAKVIVADIDAEGARAVAAEIHGQAVTLDVRERERVEELIQQTAKDSGRLDYLFNNAGIAVSGDARDLTPEIWQEIVDINLMGVIYGCQAAYPLMARQGHGHIINTASLAGLLGAPGMTPYATTKAAVIGLTRSLNSEGQKLGVKVSALCPGFIESRIYESARCINMRSEDVRKLVTLPMLDTDQATRKLLKGVLAGKELIVIPGYARILNHLAHHAPGLLRMVGQDVIEKLRARRIQV